MEKQTYHVMRQPSGAWLVLKEGFRRPHFVSPSKEQAVILARRLAKLAPNSEVVVHGTEKTVGAELRP